MTENKERTILLVESVSPAASSLKQLFVTHGYQVIKTKTAEETLKVIEKGTKIDLILISIELSTEF